MSLTLWPSSSDLIHFIIHFNLISKYWLKHVGCKKVLYTNMTTIATDFLVLKYCLVHDLWISFMHKIVRLVLTYYKLNTASLLSIGEWILCEKPVQSMNNWNISEVHIALSKTLEHAHKYYMFFSWIIWIHTVHETDSGLHTWL